MEILIFFALIAIIALLFVIFVEIEKIVDNTLEIGRFLDRQEKRETRFSKNLDKYMKGKK